MERAAGEPHAPAARRAIVLAGFMGAGKSSAASALAGALGVEAQDTDAELERELGEPIESFFEREGEEAFRELEEAAVLRLLGAGGSRVVALGGGALGSPRVREALRAHLVVHLEVGVEEAWRRTAGAGRPLARDREAFGRLHAERLPLYEAVADATLPAGDAELPRRAAPALRALEAGPAGLRLVWAHTASGDYPVFFGSNLVGAGFFFPRGRRRFVVADENAASRLELPEGESIPIPSGEEQKTLGRAEELLRELARRGATRDDLVVGFGGGVVGDLSGFCAAVYQRGMDHVQVPTTLVAQVDSAYGGKTGVDIPEAKNYVGAYHQPSAVLADPWTLRTLPQEERAAGWAEVVKTALIAGGRLWDRVRRGYEVDDDVILGCIRTKLAVVAEDERDEGRRQVLNLGHTVAHALEAATGYRRLRHGEAVGLGLLCALRLSGQEAIRSEVLELLGAAGLPQAIDGVDPESVVGLVARDKKRRGEDVPFVLVEAPGRVTPGHRVDPDGLRAAVEEVVRA
jgi:shikimate kinase/3-dehydroquinate synthase